eukprot:gene4597-6780_t
MKISIAMLGFILLGKSNAINRAKITTDNNGSLHLVAPNIDSPVFINGIDLFQALRRTKPCDELQCPAGYYRIDCNRLKDGTCVPCPLCSEAQYISGCHGVSKGVCLNVTNCHPENEYEALPPTSTTDRVCHSCISDLTLDCMNETARNIVIEYHVCQVKHVENCCCDEFYLLLRVNGNVNVRNNEASLTFGRIKQIYGDIEGSGEWNAFGMLQSVHFGNISQIGGHVDFTYNNLVLINFGSLLVIGGRLDLRSNALPRIDFGNLALVSGNVWLFRNEITEVNFGAMKTIDGSFQIQENDLRSIDFGGVSFIHGNIDASRNQLTGIMFGSIKHIMGSLNLIDNMLTSIDFDAISHIDGFLWLFRNMLTHIDFGAIKEIEGAVWIQDNHLTSIHFGGITHLGSHLYVHSNQLTHIDFGSITYVHHSLNMRNNMLTSLDFGLITHIGTELSISGNLLTSIDLSQITYLQFGIYATENPKLHTIDCKNLGSCVCHGANTVPENCGGSCTNPKCH